MFSGNRLNCLCYCFLGPPILPILTALNPEMGSNGNVTLKCEAYRLDHKKRYSYRWKWKLNHGGEIKEHTHGKYEKFESYSTPDSCQQSKGLVALQIRNVSSQDLGQYKCGLQLSDMILAEKDVSFFDFGKSKLIAFMFTFQPKCNDLSV